MNEQPLSVWQQCRSIAETAMRPDDHEQNVQRVRSALLAQLAALGDKGAALAARLADSDGPIEVSSEDIPEGLLPVPR
jgi:hypothetical protein